MCRVGNYNIRLRHRLHHSSPAGLHHFTPYRTLNFRTTFCFFPFIFHFLLGHLHLFFKLEEFKQVISNSHYQIYYTDYNSNAYNQVTHIVNRCLQRYLIQIKQHPYGFLDFIISYKNTYSNNCN